MIFETSENITYAIQKDAKYKGKIHQELLFAEIIEEARSINGQYARVFVTRWEDDWFNGVGTSETLDGAKQFVRENFQSHTPISNGKSYDVKES
jgi:hypothetical protein